MTSSHATPQEPFVGRYKVIRELGRGGMGVVHLAHDLRTHRDVALKRIFSTSRSSTERFRREYRALAAIKHTGVPAIYDIGETPDGKPYLTMEIVTGETLLDHLRRGPLDPLRALTLAIELGRVLMAVHAVGIIHRDVKPNNVILEPGDRVRLLDFGICYLTSDYYRQPHLRAVTGESERWRTSDVEFGVGNFAYTDPAHFNEGRTTQQNDVFSVCVVLYELITGRQLWDAARYRHREVLAEEFSPHLAPLVVELQRGVADVAERHQSMTELVRALEIVRPTLTALPRSSSTPPPSPARTALWLGGVAAVSFALGVAASRVVAPAGAETVEQRPAAPPVSEVPAEPREVEAGPGTSPITPTTATTTPPTATPTTAPPVSDSPAPPRDSPARPRKKVQASHGAASWDSRITRAEAHARRCLEEKGEVVKPRRVTIAAGELPRVHGVASDSPVSKCIREALARFDLEVDDGERLHTFFADP